MEDEGGRTRAPSDPSRRTKNYEKNERRGNERKTVRFRTHFTNNLLFAMRERGWEEWAEGQGELDWDIFWYAWEQSCR